MNEIEIIPLRSLVFIDIDCKADLNTLFSSLSLLFVSSKLFINSSVFRRIPDFCS
jgi:hypothetical protein